MRTSTPLGKKLFDLADAIAKGTNPHLWADNRFTPSAIDGPMLILPAPACRDAVKTMKRVMDELMSFSAFFDPLDELELPELPKVDRFELLAQAWNQAQNIRDDQQGEEL